MTYARLVDDAATAVDDALSGRARGIAARTSGSTGEPREVLLSGKALKASALATLDRLGGPAHWLLAVPADRIAGAMVHARVQVADASLTRIGDVPFTPDAFCRAADAMEPGRRYVSLVPTQVRRLLADPSGSQALASFDAVLVGGAAPGMELPANAIETYGMTETAGGCVYDGVPLPGVQVRTNADNRICIAGPTLADGYADSDNSAFTSAQGLRWFVTNDVGSWDGSLTIHGRADDVIITGGHNVHPSTVERAVAELPGVREAVAVGVPDPEWGERVAIVIDAPAPAPSLARMRDALDLPRHSLPRQVVVVRSVPRTEAGKIDRSAARALAAAADVKE
ncbi:AMP-binding enzyme [Demequina flava]|uniref:AMP-binding enzyme n=1 Tax=Demequina flava TaxID=1095025 RepID=UPI000780B48A|nr:AMP-binding protein [Demequina flava]